MYMTEKSSIMPGMIKNVCHGPLRTLKGWALVRITRELKICDQKILQCAEAEENTYEHWIERREHVSHEELVHLVENYYKDAEELFVYVNPVDNNNSVISFVWKLYNIN